jgi:hypothetical protein
LFGGFYYDFDLDLGCGSNWLQSGPLFFSGFCEKPSTDKYNGLWRGSAEPEWILAERQLKRVFLINEEHPFLVCPACHVAIG